MTRDPRLSGVSDADLLRQYQLSRDIQAERVRVAVGLSQADGLREQIKALRDKSAGLPSAASRLDSLSNALDRVAGPSLQSYGGEADELENVEPTSLRRIAELLSQLQSAVESADAAPTRDAELAFGQRRELAVRGLARWRDWLSTELPAVVRSLETAGLPGLRQP